MDEAPAVDPEIHRALGLTDDEAAEIASLLGRQPNHLELAMYSVMWSEHCSYKSSRIHLKRLPTEAPWVLVAHIDHAGILARPDEHPLRRRGCSSGRARTPA